MDFFTVIDHGSAVQDNPGKGQELLALDPPCRCTLREVLGQHEGTGIVLREHELRYMNTLQHMSFLQTGYTIEKTFRSDPVHTGEVFRAASNIDLTFVLLKKSRP